MSRADLTLLLTMTERELADIGISRSDLPRLCTDCTFGGYFYDAFLCNTSVVYDRTKLLEDRPAPKRERSTVEHGFRTTIVRTTAALSAVLITWAIFSLIGASNAEGLCDAPPVGQSNDNVSAGAGAPKPLLGNVARSAAARTLLAVQSDGNVLQRWLALASGRG